MLSSSSFLCIFLTLIALLFIAAAPLGHRNKQFLRLNESSEDAATTQSILMADSSPIEVKNVAREIGDDVEFYGEGEIELKLLDFDLRFKVPSSCTGISNVCYDSDEGLENGGAGRFCPLKTSYCGFNVSGTPVPGQNFHFLVVNNQSIQVPNGEPVEYSMAYPNVEVQEDQKFKSCNPKYQGGIVKLYSYARLQCPITAESAKIHLPDTASPAPSHKSSNGDAAAASTGFFGSPGGIVVIVVLVLCPILCIAGIAGLIIFFLAKKTNVFKSKKPAPVESIQWNYDSTIEADECKTAIYNPNFTEFEKDLPSTKKLRAKRAAERKAAAEAKAAKKKAAAEAKAVAEKKAAEAKAAGVAAEKKVKTDPTQEPTKTDENAPPPTVFDEDAAASPPQKPPPPPALTLAEKLVPPRRKRKSKHYPRKMPSSEENQLRLYGKIVNKK